MQRDGARRWERGAVMAARLPAPSEPFADDDTAGFGYFATDIHYQHLAAAIARPIAETRGFVLVTGEPAPDGNLIERCLSGGKAGECRVSLVRCRRGMGLDELMQAFGRQLWLHEESEGGLWPVLSQLMQDSRKGIMRILVLQNADALDDRSLDELHRFTRLDEPHFLPVVLLASPSFAERLDAPTLQFLKPAIAAHLPLQRLEPEEVAAFIGHQLRTAGWDEDAFECETIAAIAEAAQGDPAMVNRLARQAAGLFARSRALVDPRAVDAIPVDVEVVSSPRATEIVDVA
ncbi:MAG TPA: AAA family ATPase, partial [Stellaceae bacterium]